MMKKMTKAALLAAALAFTAGLAGCFVSAVEDDGPGNGNPGGTTNPDGTPVVVDAVWDFSNATLVSTVTTDSNWNDGKPSADIKVTATSGSGATFTLVSQTTGTLKLEGSVLKFPNNDKEGKSASKFATLTVNADCTVVIEGQAAGDSNTNVNRSLTVGGKKYEQAAGQSKDSFTLAVSAEKGTTYEFVAMGVNISKIMCE